MIDFHCCQQCNFGDSYTSHAWYVFEGGTADITVQKISSTGNVHNLHKASGGPWGGNQINKVFMELLVKLFGESTFGDFCKENMDDFFNISQKIEVNKRLISTVKDETVKIDIPATLVEKLAEM